MTYTRNKDACGTQDTYILRPTYFGNSEKAWDIHGAIHLRRVNSTYYYPTKLWATEVRGINYTD